MKSSQVYGRTSAQGIGNRHLGLAIEYLPPQALKLDPENARVHSASQIQQIACSIETFGFNVPVQVDSTGKVVAGHGRVLAARDLGLSFIPVIRLEHLTPAQLRAFAIADNKLTENAEWNPRLLGEQLKALSDAGLEFSVEATGFEMGEIDVLIEGLAPASENAYDPADAVPDAETACPITEQGDLWLLGPHRVYCGNSLNERSFLTLMQNRRAAIVITDPPYNLAVDQVTGLGNIRHNNFKMAAGEMKEAEFTDFLAQVCNLLGKHSVDGSIHFLFMDWRHISELLAAGNQVYSELKNVCVWVKDNGGMGSLYRSQHELIFVFKNGKESHRNNVQLGQYGRYRTNVWHYPGVNSFSRSTDEGNLLELQPTVKPVALVADAIMDCTSRRDIVLDPFLGSGTTVVAAERTGRTCFGIELDAQYVDTIVRRWQAFTGQSATHESSGRSFTELEKEAGNERKG